MFERLIFPTLVEQEGCRQLLRENWPTASIVDLGDKENFILEIHMTVAPASFFKWAYVISQNPGTRVLIYCFTMSLLMHTPPDWMRDVLIELRKQKLLRE
jgi:hypothetical protein